MHPATAHNMYNATFDALASPATYTPPGGASAVNTRAQVKRGMVPVGDFVQASQPTIVINLPVADVPTPRSGATVDVPGQGRYTVERRQAANGYRVTVTAREATP